MIEILGRLKAKTRTTEAGCWEWIGFLLPNGYGRISWNGEKQYIHRVAYEIFAGPISAGLEIDHLCRNRACWRPSHLEAVTRRVNTLRGESFAATKARQTHCVNDHPFDDANTYFAPNGTRKCKECRRVARQRSYRKQREAA